MDDRFDECLAFTLRAEGGYVDDPADPGGATNMGVTLATLREWSDDPSLGANQVQDMSLRTARAIYDFGVNAGIWHSARLLQRALRFTGDEVDGSVGPETLAAAAKADTRLLVDDLAERQSAFYRGLADFPIFGRGWLTRTEERKRAALAMITGSQPTEA